MDNKKIVQKLRQEAYERFKDRKIFTPTLQVEIDVFWARKMTEALQAKDDLIREMLEESRQIVEPYVQMEGFKPETAPEAYQQNVLEEIYDEWKDWKQKWLDKINHK